MDSFCQKLSPCLCIYKYISFYCIGLSVLGLGQDSILSAVHPDAPALFNVDTSLERVNYTYMYIFTVILLIL